MPKSIPLTSFSILFARYKGDLAAEVAGANALDALRDGDTVYSVLSRAVRYNKIQMEYQGARDNPFGSVYIQGINYLYEFSCGELSGWMYRVNGKFPEYGCSLYGLSDGDVIEWVYTCDLGRDVGCEWMAGGGIK